jgi:ATP-dependent Clp protease protease subunit
LQDIIRNIIARQSGKPIDEIIHDTDRDFFLNPQQAVEYGLIDEILKPKKQAPGTEKKEK